MPDNPTMRVTIDKITGNGHPIAKEEHEGSHIHVPDGEKGETYDVEIFKQRTNGFAVGVKDSLTPHEKNKCITEYKKMLRKQRKRKKTRKREQVTTTNTFPGEKNDRTKNDLLNGKF